MKKIFILYLPLMYLSVLTSGAGSCSQHDSPCSTNEQCCPISNGKSYCNLKTKRCESLRYCAENSSSSECPFNDLSASEIENVVKIIRKSKLFSAETHFPIVRKQEPKKVFWNSGDNAAKQRIAYAAVYDLESDLLSEVLVSLSTKRIISVKKRKDSVSVVTAYEFKIAGDVLRNDPRVIRAYERRGLNATYAAFDTWAIGALKDGNVAGRRRLKVVPNYKDPATRIIDFRPVEGLAATIDIANKKIVNFIDKDNIPVPKPPCIADINDQDHMTPPVIEHSSETMPESSFNINGYQIKWHNWKFQYSMDPIHGLQLYHIRYFADGEERFLIYKLSVSEMFVPYGGGGENWRWRGAFDAGEYGFGKWASPLMLGVDVPPNAKLLSCPRLNDLTGKTTQLKGCIAMYEQDASPMYRHYEAHTGSDYGAKGTNLVVTFMATVGNYDYMFDIIFSIDGNIEVCVFATGIVLQRGVDKKKNDPNCIEDCQDYVHEHNIAPLHQHFFNYRIDFDIDGTNNMMTEVDFVNDPEGPENPDGGAFSLRRTLIRKETFRDFSAPNARFWNIINTQSRNQFNTPRGYSLHPQNIGFTFLKPGPGRPLNQAMFITHPIWVSIYNDDEQCAAGTFPRSGISGQGLPQYIKDEQSLDNKDLVVWHTFAISHSPRPEEFPFMNRMHFGFHILSRNFQSANPSVVQYSKC